jgi:hypothetical protein
LPRGTVKFTLGENWNYGTYNNDILPKSMAMAILVMASAGKLALDHHRTAQDPWASLKQMKTFAWIKERRNKMSPSFAG